MQNIYKLKTKRIREVRWFAQGHTAFKGQILGLPLDLGSINLGSSIPPRNLHFPCWILQSADTATSILKSSTIPLPPVTSFQLASFRFMIIWCSLPFRQVWFHRPGTKLSQWRLQLKRKRTRKRVNIGCVGSENNFRGNVGSMKPVYVSW